MGRELPRIFGALNTATLASGKWWAEFSANQLFDRRVSLQSFMMR
jgi:hypothetical protein